MTKSTKSKAYNYLREKLVNGTFLPGSRLSAAGLAREIGISHIPVREALSQLQSEGFVDIKPQCGAFVRRLRRQELVDMIEFRKVIECNAAAQAARRITDAQADELESHLQMLRDLADQNRFDTDQERLNWIACWAKVDLAFHMGLLLVAGNQYAIKALGDANVMIRMFGQRTDVPDERDQRSQSQNNYLLHADILAAVRSHDPKAARRAMAKHMKHTGKHILARYDWLNDQENLSTPLAKDLPESVREELSKMESSGKEL